MPVSDIVLNSFIVLFTLCSTMSIVLFVGWLTHAGYHYKIIKNDEWELLVGIHYAVNIISALGATLGYFIHQNELLVVSLGISALYISSFIICYFLFFLFDCVSKVRQYFAHKRGLP